MLVHPRIGQRVRAHYNKTKALHMPLHGQVGTVKRVGKGPGPRNHEVEVGGVRHVIPCGQLNKVEA